MTVLLLPDAKAQAVDLRHVVSGSTCPRLVNISTGRKVLHCLRMPTMQPKGAWHVAASLLLLLCLFTFEAQGTDPWASHTACDQLVTRLQAPTVVQAVAEAGLVSCHGVSSVTWLI
jgi:hypothetical protein